MYNDRIFVQAFVGSLPSRPWAELEPPTLAPGAGAASPLPQREACGVLSLHCWPLEVGIGGSGQQHTTELPVLPGRDDNRTTPYASGHPSATFVLFTTVLSFLPSFFL